MLSVTCMAFIVSAIFLSSANFTEFILKFNIHLVLFLQCFDAVGWAAGRASGL